MSLFVDKTILFETMHFRDGDYTSALFFKTIVNNLSYIEEYLSSYDYSIHTIEDVFDFLWLLDFIEMSKELDIFEIDEISKSRIYKLVKSININRGEFVNFIDNDPKFVFTKQNINEPMYWHIYLPKMLSLCFNEYSSSLKQNVFDYIEENLYLNVLSSFDEYQKYYSKHKVSFKKLFINLKNTEPFDDQVYTKFLLKNNNTIDAKFLSEQAQFICERAYEEIIKMGLDSEKKEITQAIYFFDEYYELARFYKLKCANKYNVYKPKIEKALTDYVEKYGYRMDSCLTDLKPFLNLLEKDDDVYKFRSLTHTLEGNKYYNNLNRVFETEERDCLSELFPPMGMIESNNYPIHRQEFMNFVLSHNSGILRSIIIHHKLSIDFLQYLFSICSSVQSNYFDNRINIYDEIGGSYEMLRYIYTHKTIKQKDNLLYKALCNGCCVNLCGTIEKILRNIIVKEESDNIYIDESKLTLGQILSRSHNLSSISDSIKYYLKYILLSDEEASTIKEKRPGRNIRNWQMHNSNDKYDKTECNDCVELLYLTISLVGDLYVTSLVHDNK